MYEHDPWGQTPKFLHHKQYYVYLRSRLDLENDDAATDAAVELFGNQPDILSPGGDYNTFANGLVARVLSNGVAEVLAAKWRAQLAVFDAWAIHDAVADVAESIVSGPCTQALMATRLSFSQSLPVTQAFIVYHPSNHEPHRRFDPDRASDAVRSQWQAPSQSAFHFRNGRILFAAADAPASILARRMEGKHPRVAKPGRPLHKEVHEIAFHDGRADDNGLAYYAGGTAWQLTKIYDDESEDSDYC